MRRGLILILLSLILLLAALVRLYKLGVVPAGLYVDEAAQGYNAFSILKTGKDEFGMPYPLVFRSFADFKTPIYTYLIVPFIRLFGLSEFTVRFPSFLFSWLTLPILFLLIRKITSKKYALPIGLTTTFLLAVSPWHVLFGRTDFESNVALFFLIAGIYFFYKGLEKPKQLVLSALILGVAILTYHAQRIVTPLMIIILFVRFRKKLTSRKFINYLLIGSLVGLLILFPTLKIANTPGFWARASGLNVFSQLRQKPSGYIDDCKSNLCLLGNNSLFLSTKEFTSLYTTYFSPRSLFFLGDYEKRVSLPNLSTFYFWQLPFYILGLILIAKKKDLGELRYLTTALLLVSPIPAAITRDPYSTIRSFQMVVPINIIIALGIVDVFFCIKIFLKKKALKTTIYYLQFLTPVIVILTVIYCLAKIYSSVFILNEYYRSRDWNYGLKQVAGFVDNLNPNLPVIVDDSRMELYAQLLFFLKFDPNKYQTDNFEVSNSEYYSNMNRVKTKKIGNTTTRPIDWNVDLLTEKYLIGDALSISNDQIQEHKLSLIKKIYFPDKSTAFIITKTNPGN